MKTRCLRSKLLATAIVLSGAIGVAMAQNDYKVLETSAKKAPVWFEKSETDYIITSSVAPTIEQARVECLDNVRKRIIESVAQNVQFSTSSQVSQTTGSAGIEAFRDDFASSLKTQAANVPFIKGVSVSKIEDSYWQKRQDKQTKVISYIYAIKYPFPSLELKKMVRMFEEQDAEMVAKLKSLEAVLDNVTSLEQIERGIAACAPLEAYFFDNVRKGKVHALQVAYRRLYDNIVVQSNDVKLGQAQILFQLNGRQIAVSQIPTLKSDCATQLRYSVSGEMGVLQYAWENCLDSETSEIQLTYRFGARVVTAKIYFCPDNYRAAITPVGTVLLNRLPQDGLALDMELEIARASSVTIEELTLEIPEVEGVVMLNNLDQTVTGDATHRLHFSSEVPVSWRPSNLTNIMHGTMRGTYGESKTPFTRVFTLIYKMKL